MTKNIPAAESDAAPLSNQPVAQLLPASSADTTHGARVGANSSQKIPGYIPWDLTDAHMNGTCYADCELCAEGDA